MELSELLSQHTAVNSAVNLSSAPAGAGGLSSVFPWAKHVFLITVPGGILCFLQKEGDRKETLSLGLRNICSRDKSINK